MKIVMTGATGYIGNKLAERLFLEKHEIYAVVRPESEIRNNADILSGIIKNDSYENILSAFQEIRPELFINVAGYYINGSSFDQMGMLFDANVLFPSYITEAFVRSGGKAVVHTSSVHQCYDGAYYNPVNFYAATKQAYEDILYYYASAKGIRAVVLQLFDTYGEDDTRKKVFNLVRALKDGDKIEMSPGEQKMYFCHISDVVEAYIQSIRLLDQKKGDVFEKYAVRGEEPVKLKKFISMYCEKAEKKVRIYWGKRPYMEREIMDPSRIGIVLPEWQALVDYEDGLSRCAQWDTKKI